MDDTMKASPDSIQQPDPRPVGLAELAKTPLNQLKTDLRRVIGTESGQPRVTIAAFNSSI